MLDVGVRDKLLVQLQGAYPSRIQHVIVRGPRDVAHGPILLIPVHEMGLLSWGYCP